LTAAPRTPPPPRCPARQFGRHRRGSAGSWVVPPRPTHARASNPRRVTASREFPAENPSRRQEVAQGPARAGGRASSLGATFREKQSTAAPQPSGVDRRLRQGQRTSRAVVDAAVGGRSADAAHSRTASVGCRYRRAGEPQGHADSQAPDGPVAVCAPSALRARTGRWREKTSSAKSASARARRQARAPAARAVQEGGKASSSPTSARSGREGRGGSGARLPGRRGVQPGRRWTRSATGWQWGTSVSRRADSLG